LGKSAIIDAISHMSLDQVREVAPPGAPDEFCLWFVNSVHVSIDFNGWQTPMEAELEQPIRVERMMAVRVLHRFGSIDSLRSLLAGIVYYHLWTLQLLLPI
jgi:hypothetical protein